MSTSDNSEPLSFLLAREVEKLYEEQRAQREMLIQAWREYRDEYLTVLSKEEAIPLYDLAMAEAVQQLGGQPFTEEERQAGFGLSQIEDRKKFLDEVVVPFEGQLFTEVINRLWEAGFLITYDRELYSYLPYTTAENLIWKVKPDAPELPESAFTGFDENPIAGLKLGSKPLNYSNEIGTFRIQTSPIAAHMQEFMRLNVDAHSATRETKYNGKSEKISMSSSVHIKAPEEVAQKIFDGIMKRKGTQSTHLLKLHLDLCDRAAQRGGEAPVIWYDIHAAADRMGYSKIPGRDSYDPKTLREIHERIKVLENFHIDIGKMGTGKKAIHLVTPYWRRRDVGIEEKDLPLNEHGQSQTAAELMGSRNAPTPRMIEIQPGSWWGEMNRAQYLCIPAEVLKLPIDGKGNERNRMAVEICATLAVWERAGAFYSPSQTKTLGAVLEGANIATLEELKANKHAARLKENLQAALEIVRNVGGFDVEYVDADADATGRGWHTRFWEARIRLTARLVNGVNEGRMRGEKRPLKGS